MKTTIKHSLELNYIADALGYIYDWDCIEGKEKEKLEMATELSNSVRHIWEEWAISKGYNINEPSFDFYDFIRDIEMLANNTWSLGAHWNFENVSKVFYAAKAAAAIVNENNYLAATFATLAATSDSSLQKKQKQIILKYFGDC